MPNGALRARLDLDEAELLDQLTGQLIELLQSHSGTALDPDPLFANLEVGGSDELPDDPALARLFPDAYEEEGESADFRRVSEQGLLNRKLHDAMTVVTELGLGAGPPAELASDDDEVLVEVSITDTTFPAWVRTLTALRLAIAARIGIIDEADHVRLLADEEARGTVLVYDWLGAILDSMLRMQPTSHAGAARSAGS